MLYPVVMTDRITPERRSWNMSRIKGKDTLPERIVRSLLHRMGYRFRLHAKTLPGKPDIAMPKHRLVVEIRGCYWHRHRGCSNCTTPSTRKGFWKSKFRATVGRDSRNARALKELGWRVVIVWECETKDSAILAKRLKCELTRACRLA